MNQRILSLTPSLSMALMEEAKRRREKGEDIINLSAGEPDFPTPGPIKEAAVRSLRADHTHYLVGKGDALLRERIAMERSACHGLTFDKEEVILFPGAKMAIFEVLMTLLKEGEEIILPTPSWLSYDAMIKINGACPVELPIRGKLTRKALESVKTEKSRALLICDPNNPTGHVLSPEERAEVSSFLRDNPQIWLILDEIYDGISYVSMPTPRFPFEEEFRDRLILINGFSKTYAMTGWRLGYAVLPLHLMKELTKLHGHTVTGTPTFVQEAAREAYTEEVRRLNEERREIYRKRRDFMTSALLEIPVFQPHVPDGSFYYWADFSFRGMTDMEFTDYCLRKAGVILLPGSAYGSGSGNSVRMSFALSEDKLEEAMKRLRNLFREVNHES